jgi:6-phosphogluconolactonase (cycloisomerase 2 family)
LWGAAAAALARCALGSAQEVARRAAAKRTLAYVGTYTGAVGAGSNGEGIYLFEMNEATGELTNRRLVAKTPDPSWIAIHPSKKFLYAVNEVSDFHRNSGSVSAFAIDASGDLTALNVVSSEGAGPCYLSIDTAGKFVFVANYGGGTVAALPILEGGLLGAASGVQRDSGHLGAAQASDAPAGSFAVSGHDAPHAHMIAPDPEGRFVLATDLGQDRIYVYRVDPGTGTVNFGDGVEGARLPSGDGPRHFAFHPNGSWLYAIQEESSTVAVYRYDGATGALAAEQTVSTLPEGFAGTSFASEILVSPDGRFLYAANRLHDTIAAFSIGADGRLKWRGETPTMGDYPGQTRIDPSGRFLYACNRKSDSITCFRIHRESGMLTFTGLYTAVGSPGSITFLS